MNLEHLAVSPSGFVFDPMTGATFSANESACLLLDGIREGQGLEGLVERLQGRFEPGEADLRRDVLEFVRSLQELAILPRSFELD